MQTGTAHMFSQEDFAADEFISLRFDVTFFVMLKSRGYNNLHWPSLTPLCVYRFFLQLPVLGPPWLPSAKPVIQPNLRRKPKKDLKTIVIFCTYCIWCVATTLLSILNWVLFLVVTYPAVLSFPHNLQPVLCFAACVCWKAPKSKSKGKGAREREPEAAGGSGLPLVPTPRQSWCLFRRCRKATSGPRARFACSSQRVPRMWEITLPKSQLPNSTSVVCWAILGLMGSVLTFADR